MKNSLRVLSAAFASAMLLLGPGEAVAGGDWGWGGGYSGYDDGGYGYGDYGYGGYGYGDFGYGGYGKGYGYGGFGKGYGGYGKGYGKGGHYYRGLIDRVDVCYDDYLGALNVRFRVKGGGRFKHYGIPVTAIAEGEATCYDDGKKGNKGYYGELGYFEDVYIDETLAYPVHGNRWETIVLLDGYDSYICGYDYGHYDDLDLYGLKLIIGSEVIFLDDAYIPTCYDGWYDAWWD